MKITGITPKYNNYLISRKRESCKKNCQMKKLFFKKSHLIKVINFEILVGDKRPKFSKNDDKGPYKGTLSKDKVQE